MRKRLLSLLVALPLVLNATLATAERANRQLERQVQWRLEFYLIDYDVTKLDRSQVSQLFFLLNERRTGFLETRQRALTIIGSEDRN